MRAAVEARPCKRNGCRNGLPAHTAPQARYCGTENCDRERAAERKALQHAREENAFTRVVLELEEGPKPRTSEDQGERGASMHRTPEHVLHRKGLKLEDENSPGELWLCGKVEAAQKEASKRRRKALAEAEAREWGGGDLWNGLKSSPPRHRWQTVELSEPKPSPFRNMCDSVMRANRGLG